MMKNLGFDASSVLSINKYSEYGNHIINILAKYYPHNQYFLYSEGVSIKEEQLNELKHHPNLHLKYPHKFFKSIRLSGIWKNYFTGFYAKYHGIAAFHGLTNELPANLPANVRKVVTVHDPLSFRHPELLSDLERQQKIKKLKETCQAADKIITLNHLTAEELVSKLNIFDDKIHVVYQGCDDMYSEESDPIAMDRIFEKHGVPIDFVLAEASDFSNNNLSTLIRAFAALKNRPELNIVFIHATESSKTEIVKLASETNISDKVIILPQIPPDEISKIFQTARVFINISTLNINHVSILKALCAKAPVIASKGFCTVELGGPDSLYVDALNVEEITNAIKLIWNNTSQSGRMIYKGQEYARRFSNDKIADDLMRIYFN